MAEERLSGDYGTYFMGATTAYTAKKFSMIEIVSDAVFTRLTAKDSNGETYDALVTQNLTGATVTAGRTISVPEGHYFSAVTMSSGTAIGINTQSSYT